MGTPSFALPSLKKIAKGSFEVISVITQPDRPKGRGVKSASPEVKILAAELGIPVVQPADIQEKDLIISLQKLAPDLVVVVAYGQILPRQILDIPEFGCINLHASLLPQLRGAAPIQWSIILGKNLTGVTTIYMDEGMDTGDVILQKEIEISEDETSGGLSERLSAIGADLLFETLGLIEQGRAPGRKQDEDCATYAPLIKKEDGLIDWSKPAIEIHNLIRGLNPAPGAYSYFGDKRIKIYRSRVAQYESGNKKIGETISLGGQEMVVKCGEGALSILELQPEGKRPMNTKSFLTGHRIMSGMKFFISPQSGTFF